VQESEGTFPPGSPSADPASNPRAVPWRGKDVALIFGVGIVLTLVTFLAVAYILAASDSGFSIGPFAFAQLVSYGGLALVAWYVVFRRRGAAPEHVGFTWVGVRPLLLMFPTLLGLLVVNVLVGVFSILLFGELTSVQEQVAGEAGTLALGDFIPLFLLTVLVVPVVEEFVFRGIFFKLLRSHRSFRVAASISAVVFSISHFIPSLALSFFAMGLILAGVVERYKSIYPAIALHALNNALAMTVVYVTLN
jgi:membrane protease YdiL (CAAX protease family)